MTGFGIDLAAMALAIKGINGTVEALNEFAPLGGHFTTTKLDFLSLCPSEDDCGDEVLGDAFEEFFDRWQWGMRHLVKEGTELVTALTDTKSVYEKAEDKAKQALHFLVGDPRSNVDASTKTWEELAKSHMEMPSASKEWEKVTKGFDRAIDSSVKDIKGADPVGDIRKTVGDLL